MAVLHSIKLNDLERVAQNATTFVLTQNVTAAAGAAITFPPFSSNADIRITPNSLAIPFCNPDLSGNTPRFTVCEALGGRITLKLDQAVTNRDISMFVVSTENLL